MDGIDFLLLFDLDDDSTIVTQSKWEDIDEKWEDIDDNWEG